MKKLFESLKSFESSGEGRYYLRDIYLFLTSVLIAVFLAESLIFSGTSEVNLFEKIIVYFNFILPVFAVFLFLSYAYRNFKTRKTGKVRSVIRYRLMIAFLLLSILQLIPIYLLSSNVVGRFIESFYKLDITGALKSAIYIVQKMEETDEKKLFELASKIKNHLNNKSISDEEFKEMIQNEFENESFQFAAWEDGKIVPPNAIIFKNLKLEDFNKSATDPFETYTQYSSEKIYKFVKIEVNTSKRLLIAKQIHLGNERLIYNIINTEKSYQTDSLWKSKVPFTFRITIGMIAIFIFIASIFFSYMMARTISNPLVILADAVYKVSRGDTDVKINLKADGELGILIESFNQMTRDIKSKDEEILHIQRIAAWKEVAQRMAHEIKNPLTPIQLSAERIKRRLESPNKDNFHQIVLDGTNTIIGQVKVLEHLVKEFSEFARMPTPLLINQSINPIVQECINLFEDTEKIHFEMKLTKSLPDVFLDKRLFQGVINNLIKNAVEAIVTDKKDNMDITSEDFLGTIRLSTKLEKKYLRKFIILTVEDSGPGIPGNLKNKIFEPYFSTKEGHGTGIGLTIVEKTVYDHNGRIYLNESSLGGCSFKIELPVSET